MIARLYLSGISSDRGQRRAEHDPHGGLGSRRDVLDRRAVLQMIYLTQDDYKAIVAAREVRDAQATDQPSGWHVNRSV